MQHKKKQILFALDGNATDTRHLIARFAFRAIRGDPVEHLVDLSWSKAALDMQVAYTKNGLVVISRVVSNSVKTDRNAHFEALSIKIDEARACNNTRLEYSILKQLMPRPPAKPQAIALSDGSHAKTPYQVRTRCQ